MTPLLAADFTPHQWSAMLGLMTYVFITYMPLQVAAVWAVKHPLSRIAALFPLIPMYRVIMIGMQPHVYNGGSLYGIMIMFVQVPAMVYLGIFVLAGLTCRMVTNKPVPEPQTDLEREVESHTSRSTTIGE